MRYLERREAFPPLVNQKDVNGHFAAGHAIPQVCMQPYLMKLFLFTLLK